MVKKNILITGVIGLLMACQVRTRSEDIVGERSAQSTMLNIGSFTVGVIEGVGAAATEFVPSEPTALAGFGGRGRRFFPPLFSPQGNVAFCRPYQSVVEPPRIKAAVLRIRADDGQSKNAFVVSLDLVAVTSDLTRMIHSGINDVMGAETAHLSNTIVLASHTHSGIAGLSENPVWGPFVCDQFNADLRESYLNAFKLTLREAQSKVVPIAAIETTRTEIPGLVKSRFDGMPSASEISVISFKSTQGNAPLSLLRIGVHPTTFGQTDLILSADLVSPLERSLREKFNSDNVFLMQTELGNMDAEFNGKDMQGWAEDVASALKQKGIVSSSVTRKLSTTAHFIPLPPKTINWQACKAQFASPFVSVQILENLPSSTPLTLWDIDSDLNAFMSGEWTTAGAKLLRKSLAKKFPEKNSLNILSLANEYTGYHLDQEAYAKENVESCSSVYGSSNAEHISENIENLQLKL